MDLDYRYGLHLPCGYEIFHYGLFPLWISHEGISEHVRHHKVPPGLGKTQPHCRNQGVTTDVPLWEQEKKRLKNINR